jgi:hypothetical protein
MEDGDSHEGTLLLGIVWCKYLFRPKSVSGYGRLCARRTMGSYAGNLSASSRSSLYSPNRLSGFPRHAVLAESAPVYLIRNVIKFSVRIQSHSSSVPV